MKDHGEEQRSIDRRDEREALDPALEQTMRDFKASVHAWGDAEFNRPRAVNAVVRRAWRLAAGWAMASVLVAGAVSGVLYERQHQREVAAVAAQEAAQERALAAARAQARAQAEDELLANVDSAVSQEVPDALEPLAALSSENASR